MIPRQKETRQVEMSTGMVVTVGFTAGRKSVDGAK
jgi:hypothetical protein